MCHAAATTWHLPMREPSAYGDRIMTFERGPTQVRPGSRMEPARSRLCGHSAGWALYGNFKD